MRLGAMIATSSPRQADPCALAGEDLVAYADGELGEDRRLQVEAHLRVCSACRRRLATFRETGLLLREKTPRIDDPAGRAAIRARCLASDNRRRPAGPHLGVAMLTLSLLLALFVERTLVEQGRSPNVTGWATESVPLTPAVPTPRTDLPTEGASRGSAAFAVSAAPRFPSAPRYGAAREAEGQGCALRGTTQCALPYAATYARGRLPIQAYAGSARTGTWIATGCPAGWTPGFGLPSLPASVTPLFPGQPFACTVAPAWTYGYGSARGFGAGI